MSRGSGGRFGYRLAHLGPLEPWLRRFVLLAAYGVWPVVLGPRRVPRGPLVVTGTHLDRQDVAIFQIATRRSLEWVGGEYFLRLPVNRAVAAWGGHYPIREVAFGFAKENAAALDGAAAAARGGAAVGIFAQGFTARFGIGPARIAAEASAPALPVFTYRVRLPAGDPRILAVVHRPLPPPAAEARSRRRFADRLRRRMHALGALRPEGDAARIRQAALDDAALWRRPLDVLRRAARLARVRDEAPLALRARFLLRACARLGCSVGDLRRPAGLGRLVAFLLLLLPAILGVALVSPPVLALLVRLRGYPAVDFRSTLLRVAPILAAPWGLVLAAAGWFGAGAWGLALPLAAAAGACCAGVARRLARQLRGSVAVRRHGHRLRARLREFDTLVVRAAGDRASR